MNKSTRTRVVRTLLVSEEEYEALRDIRAAIDRKVWLAQTSGFTKPATLAKLKIQQDAITNVVTEISYTDR